MDYTIDDLKCCGNCMLFISIKCPHKEYIDNEQIEYNSPDCYCDEWIFDNKNQNKRKAIIS